MSVDIETKRDYIGSAHIAAICRVKGAFGSPVSAWQELKFGISSFDQDNLPEAVELGNVLEPHILEHYAKMTKRDLQSTQPHYRHPEHLCLGATPDAVVVQEDGFYRLVDAKATGDYKWDEVPARYRVSSLWQIGIANLCNPLITECDLVVYHLPARKVQIYTIEHDQSWFDAVSEFAARWYEQHVVGDAIPPIDGHPETTKFIKSIIAKPAKAVDLDEHESLFEELRQAKAEAEAANERVVKLENQLHFAMGEAEIGMIRGKKVYTWKEQSGRKTIDANALKVDFPDIYELYLKQGKPFRVARWAS